MLIAASGLLGALGIAIIGTVLTTTIESQATSDFQANAVLSGPMVQYAQVGFIEIAKQPVYFEVPQLEAALTGEFAQQMSQAMHMTAEAAQPQAAQLARETAPELVPIFNDARSKGMAHAALTAAIFIGIGALSSLMLPNPKDEPEEVAPPHGEAVRSSAD